MHKLSIIVPVYNVEAYLDKCLSSLINQTLKNIEIIVVNDGSPDESQKIIDKYSEKYSNVKSFIKKNGGLSDARNYGVKKSTGDYIAFVDSDDYVEIDMFEKMFNKAISNDFDVVACGVNMVFPKKIVKIDSGFNNDCLSRKEIKEKMNQCYSVAWNKIYKKELFDKIQFKKGIWFEDVEFLYRLIPIINTIGIVDGYYYNYIQRPGSITYTYDERLYNMIDNFEGIIDFYKTKHFYDEYYNEIEFAYIRYACATFMKRLAKSKSIKKYFKGYRYIKENIKKQFPNYKKNHLFKGIKGVYLKYYNKVFALIVYFIEKNKMN